MKIFLTIELISFLLLAVSEWRFWSKTYNWRSDDGGWSQIYSYKPSDRTIRVNMNYASLILAVVGILFIIWN